MQSYRHGTPCTYCKRPMLGRSSRKRLGPTRDHVIPKHAGGTQKVWCCRFCNELKGGASYQAWLEFMMTTPRWWRPEQERACRMFRQLWDYTTSSDTPARQNETAIHSLRASGPR